MENKQGKLLIIDDVKSNRTFLSSLVELEGYDSLQAESGIVGINLLKENDISLVLLDFMMPELNGIETLKIIRSKYSALELPVIMVTAKDQTSDIVSALDNGANDYITKPLDTSVAIARIKTHYSLSRINKESQEREQRFKRLSEISFEGIIIHDEKIIIDYNQTLANLFQYKYEELKGKSLSDLFIQENVKNNDINDVTEIYNEYTGIKSNGEVFPIEVISRDIVYNGKEAKVTAIRDVSERFQYEELYKRLQENIKKVDTLSNLVPVCSWCKNIQNDKGYWQKIESFIEDSYNSMVTNSICPSCSDNIIKTELKEQAIEINKESLTVKRNGKNIYLTLGEFNILNYLYENNRIISIDELLENVMGYPPGTGNPDTIRTHITRIRSKVETNASKPEVIINIPKSGYKFNNV